MRLPPPASKTGRVEAVGLEWRAPTRADLPAWAEALAAVERVDRTGEVLGEEDLIDQFELSHFNPATDARLALDRDGIVVAYGTVEHVPNPRQDRVLLEGAVRPDWRGRGVGTALIGWQVERGLVVGAGRGTNAPGWLELTAEQEDEHRSALFAEQGFHPLRYSLEMRRPLCEELPAPVVPAGLRIVPFDFRLDDTVRAVRNETFADHWGSTVIDKETWGTWVTGNRDFRADVSFIGLERDDVVGYAINALHPDDWPGLGFTEGWTHHLGVRTAWRGRGVATALLGATLIAFSREGLDFAALDVDAENPTGALALYEGAGYERDRCQVAWARDLD